MPASRSGHCIGLPPVIGDDPAVLILGSFPSVQSLSTGRYYANPQNQFWKIMQYLLGIDSDLPYRQRIQLLSDNHIALWDAVGSCLREGSADNRIREPVLNDIACLITSHPSIQLITCNGGASATYASNLRMPDSVEMLRLPSTSPAYAAMSLTKKIACWSVLCRYI
jgi:TDG/mug DNA glycosylase family protein